MISRGEENISLQEIEEAVQLSHKVGLQTIGYFMIGSPGESPETIQQTIRFAKKLKLDFAQFACTTPFPGTKLYDLYLDSNRGNNISWGSFVYSGSSRNVGPMFESSLLSRDGIQYWIRRAYREFYLRPSYLFQRLRRTKSIGDLKVSIKGLSMLLGNIRPGVRKHS